MTEMREWVRCRRGAETAPVGRRIARKALLLGGCAIAGWIGLAALGGQHAAEAATPVSGAHPAGLLGAVTASLNPGSNAAHSAPSAHTPALPDVSGLAPVTSALGLDRSSPATSAPASASPVSSAPVVRDVPVVADVTKPVDEALSAVTAPIRHATAGTVSSVTGGTSVTGPVDKVVDPIVHTVTGTDSAPAASPAPAPTAAEPAPGAAPAPQAPPQRNAAQPTVTPRHHATATHRTPEAQPHPMPAHHRTAVSTTVVRPYLSVIGAVVPRHSAVASNPAGSLRSGTGAPAAPPEAPAAPPVSMITGSVSSTSVPGSAGLGSALSIATSSTGDADSAALVALHTVRHDNARIARSAAAQPSCSPD